VTRRLRAALTALAVLLATVGLAAPASAAEFTGSVPTPAEVVVRAGETAHVVFDASGLAPSPDSARLVVQQQSVDGGPITQVYPSVTGFFSPTSLDLDVVTSTAHTRSYLFLVVVFSDPSGAQYQVTAQVRVDPPLLTPGAATLPYTGTPRVGSTLTVDVDATWWTPAADAVAIEWWDVDTNTVIGTGPSYALTAADLGRTLYAQATATRTDHVSSTVTTPFIGAVGPGAFTLDAAPQIDGGLRIGTPVTVSAPVLTPAPTSVGYQWYLQDGTPIAGATGATFTPQPEHLGASVYVLATAHLADYQDHVSQSNVTGAVALTEQVVTQAPTLPSTAQVGVPLTVTAPVLAVAPDSIDYQWYLLDGTPIAGATGTTFTPTAAEVGTSLYVLATAHRAWAQDHVVQSTVTGAVALRPFGTAPTPTITGTALLGTVLTADPHAAGWSPAATSFTYQWYRGSATDTVGAPVAGATAATYAPTASDVGSWFFVEVTAHGPGLASHVIGSAPSATVRLPWAVPVDGAERVQSVAGGRLRVVLNGLAPGVPHTLELHSDPVALGTVVPAADGSVTVDVAIPASVPAGAHTLVVLRDGVSVLEVPVTVTALVSAAAPAVTPVTAAPVAAATPVLATTGAQVTTGVLAAGALLLAGGVLVAGSRRRARTR
jgi:LPXTG-motif cell wall-anchored protein